jgi:hypothetical protein
MLLQLPRMVVRELIKNSFALGSHSQNCPSPVDCVYSSHK